MAAKIKSKALFSFFLTIALLLFIYQQALAARGTNGKVMVAVSILPQSFFVERIGGTYVQPLLMVPPGANPATYAPKPQQLAGLSRCSIYFLQGVPFESAWMPRFIKANPRLKVIRCYSGIERIPIEPGSGSSRTLHHHGHLDPHMWLSPPLAFLEARNILEGLSRVDPQHRKAYENNFKTLAMKIVHLDLKIRDIFQGVGDHNCFMVYHPAWGYFARTYGLKQVAIEKGGKKPLARDLKRLVKYARMKKFKELFIQPQLSAHAAEVIARSIGAKLVPLDPLARQWDQNLLQAAKKIRAALR